MTSVSATGVIMELFSTLFPATFVLLALSHFVALLSPGPDFFLLTGYAIRYRLRGSVGIVVGIAAGNAVYIALAIAGWSALRHAPLLFTLIELLGAGYLLWIGSRLIRSRPGTLALDGAVNGAPSLIRQLMLGLGSALLNPKNALFYLALMTTLSGASVTLLQQSVAGIWMVAVVLLWDLLLVRLIGTQQVQRRLTGNVWLIERGAGAVLIAFAVWILIRFFAG